MKPELISTKGAGRCLRTLERKLAGIVLAGGVFCGGASLPVEARELSADRPDTTESPISVEPGRVQIESTLVGWSRDGASSLGSRETWSFAETNFKLGITPDFDLQLVVAPLLIEEETHADERTRAEGLGDLVLRGKWNWWGNDGGATAFGLLPHLTVPTGTEVSGGEWEAGLVTPFAWALGETWSFGTQVEIATASDERGRHTVLGHAMVVGKSLTDELGCYLEYIGALERGRYAASLSAGVTLGLSEDMQWDAGFVAGLNDAAEDVAVFTGITVRF